MTIFNNYGIYSGGLVTKSGTNEIHISPYLLSLFNSNELRGSGSFDDTYSKKIVIGFTSNPSSSSYIHNDIEPPRFLLNINNIAAGQAYILYTPNLTEDVEVIVTSLSPVAGTIVFAKITWGANTTTLAGVSIDYAERTETRLVKTQSPEEPNLFYQDGQPFTSSAVNRQYANVAVLSEVIQDQSLMTFSNEYFVTFARQASGLFTGDIYGSTTKVYLKPFKNLARALNSYYIYNLKEDSFLSPAGTAFIRDFNTIGSVQNQTIYVSIEKATAEPVVEITPPNNITHYLIAYAQVSGTETDLANITFTIVNNLIGHSTFVENMASLIKAQKTNGFLSSVKLSELPIDNKIRLEPCLLNVDGYLIYINGTDIELPAPPASGSRQDFIYIEVKKNAIPWTTLSYEIKVVEDVDYNQYPDSFLNIVKVKNAENNTYSYTRNGDYTATLAANAVDGKTHAIPLAVIQRFNTQAFSTDFKGGVGRPDNKTALRIKLSEIENKAPINRTKEKVELLNSALFAHLEGKLNNKLKPSYIDNTLYSRSPLQVDRLGTNSSIPNTSYAGLTDGIRYLWSKNTSKQSWMYTMIKEDTDSGLFPYNYDTCVYDQDTKTLTLQVPVSTQGELIRNSLGELDGVQIKWASTGKNVNLSVNWSIGQTRTSVAVINTVHPDYVAGDNIVIMFKIKYTDLNPVGLSQIPSKVINASNNNNYTSLSDSYAVALDSFTTPTFVKNIGSPVTIDSVSYQNKLNLVKLGSNTKFETYQLSYFVPGNNNNLADYEVDDIFVDSGNYALIGLIDAKNAITGESIPVTKVKWTYNTTSKFLIRLAINVPVTTPIEFIFAVGGDAGKQLDLSVGSLEITNISETANLSANASAITNPDGIYFLTNGHIIYGACSFRNETKVYVGEDLVPARIEGIGTNLLKVFIQVDDISTFVSGNWVAYGLKWIPANGATIRIPVIQSYLMGNNHIYINYEYSSNPFTQFKPDILSRDYKDLLIEDRLPYLSYDSNAYISNRGFLLNTTDGSQNESSSIYSPVAERFPVVQNIPYIGLDTPSSPLGLADILNFQQHKKPFIEGTKILFDNSLMLSGIVLGGTGISIFACLIKQLNILKLFIYQVRDGSMVLNNKDQAFVAELEENYREII